MTFLVAAVVLAVPMAAVTILLLAVDGLHRRREARIARQVAVTDAIHAELGAVVAPLLKRARRGWRVELPMAPEHPGTSRAIAIAAGVLNKERAVEIAVVAPTWPVRRASGSPRPALAGLRSR
jgi:hypothetical protein